MATVLDLDSYREEKAEAEGREAARSDNYDNPYEQNFDETDNANAAKAWERGFVDACFDDE
jgi:hypothetical protein